MMTVYAAAGIQALFLHRESAGPDRAGPQSTGPGLAQIVELGQSNLNLNDTIQPADAPTGLSSRGGSVSIQWGPSPGFKSTAGGLGAQESQAGRPAWGPGQATRIAGACGLGGP